jgi:hypothetical protein
MGWFILGDLSFYDTAGLAVPGTNLEELLGKD